MANDASLVQLIADGKIYLNLVDNPTWPTDADFSPSTNDWAEIGYYSEDGFTLSPQPGDETEFMGHNGDIVETDQLPGFWTFAFSALEYRKEIVEAYFDTTVQSDGSFEVDRASVNTERKLLGVGISKQGDKVFYACPRVKVSEREDIVHNRTTLLAHGLTFRTFKGTPPGAAPGAEGYQFKAWATKLADES